MCDFLGENILSCKKSSGAKVEKPVFVASLPAVRNIVLTKLSSSDVSIAGAKMFVVVSEMIERQNR